jgi:hypothetical protein
MAIAAPVRNTTAKTVQEQIAGKTGALKREAAKNRQSAEDV